MGKMKTHTGAKKRFKVLASGKIKRGQAFKNHILTKKGRKTKRNLRHGAYISDGDMNRVKKFFPGL